MESKMKTYNVEVTRVMKQTANIEVQAEDEDEAIENAEAELYTLEASDWDDTEEIEEAAVDADGVSELVDAEA
jgi:hypothetical protein